MTINKIFFLIFIMIMSQAVRAGESDFLEERKATEAAWIRRPLFQRMIPDTIERILKNLSLKDGGELLRVNRAHFYDVDVWRGFAGVHGISVPDDTTTAENMRKHMKRFVEEARDTFRIKIQSEEPVTPELITSFLQRAQENSFLWNTLLDGLREKAFPKFSVVAVQDALNMDVSLGHGFFQDIAEVDRRAYLNAVAAQRNQDGTPGIGAEGAQLWFNNTAYHGTLGFTQDRSTQTSAYDYLIAVAARVNSDGAPGLGAEYAQFFLNASAYHGKLGFTKDRGTPTSGYDYLVAVTAHKNHDGTPAIGAKQGQKKLNQAAYEGKLGFTQDRGTETSAYDYLKAVSQRINPDGTPGLGAKHAKKMLRQYFEEKE